MKKRICLVLMSALLAMTLTACGKSKVEEAEPKVEVEVEAIEPEEEPEVEEVPAEDVLPAGKVFSELTGLPIDEEIKTQKPIAAMVDNETKAYPHFGLNESDVVYEMMNSLANDRITRLMVIYKDWGKIEQLGSIRSTRPTNFMIAAEYNAVICHDGGPFYINDWVARPYSQNFSGIFSRVNNGKAREFTEYILPGDLEGKSAFGSGKYSTEYDEFFPGNHWTFAPQVAPITNEEGFDAKVVDLSAGFKHTVSKLIYDEATGLYTYHTYGSPHLDGKTNEPLTFTNVILEDCTYAKLDDHGYLIYNKIDTSNRNGYYITNGKAVKITWVKESETAVTKYYLENGEELVINKGKTYVGIYPNDYWDEIKFN